MSPAPTRWPLPIGLWHPSPRVLQRNVRRFSSTPNTQPSKQLTISFPWPLKLWALSTRRARLSYVKSANGWRVSQVTLERWPIYFRECGPVIIGQLTFHGYWSLRFWWQDGPSWHLPICMIREETLTPLSVYRIFISRLIFISPGNVVPGTWVI